MTTEDPALDLEVAIAAGTGLEPAVIVLDDAVFDAAAFAPPLFDRLIGLLASPLLRDHRDAVVLLKLFDDQMDLLSPAQRDRLAAAMPALFAAVRDDVAAFLAAELWVTAGGSGAAVLAALRKARADGLPPQRLAALVHGFDWLCKHADGAAVRGAALAELQQLQGHADAAVAAEARAAVGRRMKRTS